MIRTLRRLTSLARVPRGRLASATLLGVLAVAFGVGLMTTAGYLISRAAEQPPILTLTVAIVAVRFFGLARPLARYLERLASHDLALRALAGIRARVYRAIEPLAPAQLDGYRSGDLLNRMVADVDSLQGVYLRGLIPPMVAAGIGAVSVAVAAAFLPAAAAILAGGLVIGGALVPALAASLSRRTGRRQVGVRAELVARLVEALRAAPELVAYGREEATFARVRTDDRKLSACSRRDALLAGIGDSMSILVAGATAVAVLAVAVAASHDGTLEGVLVATLALLAVASFEAVAPLPGAARELSTTTAAGRRVLELANREPAIRDPAVPLPAPAGIPIVALEGVSARYGPDGGAVLRDFDLRIDPGRRVALVGPSGAGKTTVVNLLLRFLDPCAGRVAIAGRDARKYRQRDVRATFALGGQEPHLFSSTIRANLVLANPEAGESEIWAALRRARIAEWVGSLPAGLDAVVGEEGEALSGGERQRLVIARALLASAPVLILDEPTAHLDPKTASELIEDVFATAGERSVLLITHRPEGLELVDEVVDLDAGRRVGDGQR